MRSTCADALWAPSAEWEPSAGCELVTVSYGAGYRAGFAFTVRLLVVMSD